MANPGVSAKSPMQMLSDVKLEESDPSERGLLFQEINDALAIQAETEERPYYPSARDAVTRGQDDVVDEAAEEHYFVGTLLEEMSDLEADQEQFEATTRVLRENLEQHAGKEE